MQRLAFLALLIGAACGSSGSATGAASLTGVTPAVKAAATEPFEGRDGSGTNVMGWTILLFADAAGGGCMEGDVVAKVGIFTNQAVGSAPQAILTQGGIPIVAEAPPAVAGQAAANMGVEGLGGVTGLIQITDFRLNADGKTASRIEGSISAAGYDANNEGVSVTGDFVAPVCTE